MIPRRSVHILRRRPQVSRRGAACCARPRNTNRISRHNLRAEFFDPSRGAACCARRGTAILKRGHDLREDISFSQWCTT